jgi:hypothetical protein
MSDLGELFKVVSEGKKHYEETDPKGKAIKETKIHVKEDLGSLFAQLTSLKEDLKEQLIIEESKQEDMMVEDLLVEVTPLQTTPSPESIPTPEQRVDGMKYDVDKYLRGASFQQPEPDIVSKNVDDIRAKIKFLEQAIGRIAAAGPGSGEVNLRWLDDVARETIADGRWLKYDASIKKFVFDDINPFEVVENTTEVTTSTYTVTPTDFYIGVNYAGPVTIILPASANSGRMLIIKDEDGDAETNPITVQGTVDNDVGGFIIQINNGGIQLLYRNGWRIV